MQTTLCATRSPPGMDNTIFSPSEMDNATPSPSGMNNAIFSPSEMDNATPSPCGMDNATPSPCRMANRYMPSVNSPSNNHCTLLLRVFVPPE